MYISFRQAARAGFGARSRVDHRVTDVSMPIPKVERVRFIAGTLPGNYRVLQYLSVSSIARCGTICVADVEVMDGPGDLEDDNRFDAEPRRQSMKPGRAGYDGKFCNPNLGALKRFLNLRLGSRWDEVKNEASRAGRVSAGLGNVMRNCLERMVCENVIEQDGKLICPESRTELSDTWERFLFYVHPATGTLERVPRKPKRYLREMEQKQSQKELRQEPFEQVAVSELQKLVRVNGIWFLVDFEPLPTMATLAARCGYAQSYVSATGRWLGEWGKKPSGPQDILLDEEAIDDPANSYRQCGKETNYRVNLFVQAWGAAIYAVSKLQVSSRTLRRYGLHGK